MNVIVLGSLNHGSKNDPAVIARELQKDGIKTRLYYWEELTFVVTKKAARVLHDDKNILDDADLVIATGWYRSGKNAIYRDVAYSFALIAESRGVTLWNSEMGMQRSGSKFSCMVQLSLAGIPVPETVFSLGDDRYLREAPLPFIAKAAAASRGRSNYLVESEELHEHIVATLPSSRYLLQPFLPNDHDLRVICFGGEPQLVLRRSRQLNASTHLNNTSQGGDSQWIDKDTLPVQLLTNCREICKIMKREMAGIDFIPDRTSSFGYSCLEVNAIPQLTSGVDVEVKMAAMSKIILNMKESE